MSNKHRIGFSQNLYFVQGIVSDNRDNGINNDDDGEISFMSKYLPAKPGALVCEPLKAV